MRKIVIEGASKIVVEEHYQKFKRGKIIVKTHDVQGLSCVHGVEQFPIFQKIVFYDVKSGVKTK